MLPSSSRGRLHEETLKDLEARYGTIAGHARQVLASLHASLHSSLSQTLFASMLSPLAPSRIGPDEATRSARGGHAEQQRGRPVSCLFAATTSAQHVMIGAVLLLVQAYRAAASEGTLEKSRTLHRSTSSAGLHEGRGRSVSPAKSDCTR